MKLRLALPALVASVIAAANAPNAAAEERTFHNPGADGYRLDFCDSSGRDCGERVATEWCVAQGFEYASDWSIDTDIGDLQPTVRIDSMAVCRDRQCDGFAAITCGRDVEQFNLPDLGVYTRSTVFTPDRRQAAPTVARNELTLAVPGCTQFEPGALQCQSLDHYHHCRSLLHEGYGLRCRTDLNLDESAPNLQPAEDGTFDLSLRGRPSIAVDVRERGEGRISGAVRYRLSFTIPGPAEGVERCLQRDRYEYHQTGPDAGRSEMFAAKDCDQPLRGRFSPHSDDLLYAYDLCEARRAWGKEIEGSIDLVVASIFHFAAATASSVEADPNVSRTVAPYLSVGAPIEISCRN